MEFSSLDVWIAPTLALKTVQSNARRTESSDLSMSTEQKSKNITLVVTHQCNLNCTYCYEHHKNSKTMSVELAKTIVDKELQMDDGVSMIEFDFIGGEPLLEFDTIREVIEYTVQKKYDKDYIFFITTNGVLLNDERKEWLRAHSDVLQVGLSLDGTKEMHDKNRSNSFDRYRSRSRR